MGRREAQRALTRALAAEIEEEDKRQRSLEISLSTAPTTAPARPGRVSGPVRARGARTRLLRVGAPGSEPSARDRARDPPWIARDGGQDGGAGDGAAAAARAAAAAAGLGGLGEGRGFGRSAEADRRDPPQDGPFEPGVWGSHWARSGRSGDTDR